MYDYAAVSGETRVDLPSTPAPNTSTSQGMRGVTRRLMDRGNRYGGATIVSEAGFVFSRSGVGSYGLYETLGKRLLDITLVLLAAPVVLLVVGVLALLVSFDGHNPFYIQERVGRGGRVYRMWKLRTMIAQADTRLEAYLASNPDARAEWDRTQKLVNDPRITWLGRFLRKSSMDELPQLWNVLRGEMSLVGPRPMMPQQRALYPGVEYYALRPGITGLWQVSSRNESSFAERADFDARYAKSVSFKEDVRILAETVRVVAQATGH